jgi:glycosyltransferase involved in cell wall biosynthesis
VDKNAPLVAYVSRLAPGKGLDIALGAMRYLRERGFAGYLLVAGDGPLMEEAVAAHARDERVVALGQLGAEQVYALLCAADVFCSPSEYPESRTTTVLEAVACRAFVIASARGGAKELISDQSLGMILDYCTPAGLTLELEAAFADDAYRAAAVEAAYSKLASEPTWDDAARQALAALQAQGTEEAR